MLCHAIVQGTLHSLRVHCVEGIQLVTRLNGNVRCHREAENWRGAIKLGEASPLPRVGPICLRRRNSLASPSFLTLNLISSSFHPPWILSTIVLDIKDAPRTLPWVLSEIKATNSAITVLQDLILNITSTSMSRRALIGLDSLLVTLSEAVLTFGELDILIAPFANLSEVSWRSRVRWVLNERTITSAIKQLQGHKTSMLLMLNILQW